MKKTISSILLAATLLFGHASAQEAPAARPPIPSDVDANIRQWVDENPEYLLKTINQFVLKQQQETEKLGKQVVVDMKDDLLKKGTPEILGNPEGTVELVYFLDAACHYCRKMTADLAAVTKANPDLRIVQRWVSFLTPSSQYAGVVSKILFDEQREKYADFYHSLMTQTDPLTNDMIDRILAETVGGDAAASIVEKAAAGPTMKEGSDNVETNLELARRAKVEGTPFLFAPQAGIDGIRPGALDAAQLQQLVDAARAGRDRG